MTPKLKKTIIIGSIVVLLAVAIPVGLRLYKKYQDSELIQFELEYLKFGMEGQNAIATATDYLDGWGKARLGLRLKNFSPSKFTVNTIYIEVYTMNDELIVMQNKQLEKPFVISPNSDSILTVSLDVQTSGLVQVAKQLYGDLGGGTSSLTALTTLFTNYYTKGYIGTKVKLKGSFTAEGITIVNIPIDEILDI